MADYENLKGKTLSEEKTKNKDRPKTLEEELTEKYRFKSLKDNNEIYYYDSENGIFVKNAEWLIKQQYMKIDPQCDSKDVTDVINHLTWSNYIDREDFDPDIEWIAAKNCMLNLRTGEKTSHSPDFLITTRIPHNYHSYRQPLPTPEKYAFGSLSLNACPCPKIMGFLYEVMSVEDVETFLDFAAYCLWRDFPFHRWLLFNGSGRNGKGVTTNLLIGLLGRENVSTESLQRLLDRPFSAAQLYGKLANIDADLSKEGLKNTGILKKITGNDIITVEKKFKNPFQFRNHAKLIFSANQIPITFDETDAFFARLIIINFPRQFLGDKADPHLIDKLTTEQEMSGFFNFVVSRIPKVLEKGISGANQSLEDNYNKYITSSDAIRAFVENGLDTHAKDNNELKDTVYNAYVNFCIIKHLNPESSLTFSNRLTKEYNLDYRKIKKGNHREYYWIGVKLKDWKQAEEGQETL